MEMNTVQKYKESAVYTATPQELTLMLYNGAIKFCNRGIEHIKEKQVENAHTDIVKAQEIIVELQATLDGRYAVSKDMRILYEYIEELLVDGNVKKDIEKIEEAKSLIIDFRELWKEVIRVTR